MQALEMSYPLFFGGILEKKHVKYGGFAGFVPYNRYLETKMTLSSCRLLATWHTMTALTASS